MKKSISILLTLLMLASFSMALAEDTAVILPCDVAFGMNLTELQGVLGESAELETDEMDSEVGSYYVETAESAIGTLTATDLYFEVNRNNSAGEPRLNMIFCNLPVGESVIASFREALAAMTAVYGTPDSDPFDDAAVNGYREYGSLSATWTKSDVRIHLEMSRMYEDWISCDFSYRLNYDEADLK